MTDTPEPEDDRTEPLPEPEAPDADEPLGDGFPEVTAEEWAQKATKGEERELVTHVEAGVDAQWLYTAQDQLAPDPGGAPGQAPFTRGTRVAQPWAIRQEQARPERARANREALDDLEGGATELTLRLDLAARHALAPSGFAGHRGVDGIAVSTLDDLDEVLHDVLLDLAPIALDAGGSTLPAAALLTVLWERRGHEPGAAQASFRFDPLGTLAGEGQLPFASAEDALSAAGAFAREVHDSFPGSRALAIDTRAYVDAGAEAVDELAIAVASAVAYLRAADEAGLEPADAASQLELSVTVGPDQFLEIAKLRALRRMWARVLEASGVEAARRRSPVYARTAARVLAKVDPWVNILRGTTAAFAAAVGGADGITVTAFDGPLGLPSHLGRRIARNTQLVLADESNLARVTDPAGGSWYVEQLTNALAEAAWERLQALEGRGGMLAVLLDGSLAGELRDAADRRQHEVATRKRTLTGVTSFPLLSDEGLESAEPPDLEQLAAAEAARFDGASEEASEPLRDGDRLARLAAAAKEGARIDQLQALVSGGAPSLRADRLEARRDAQPFELLRAEADQRHEPRLFLACLGTLSSHVQVATWAKGFVEAGGIATVNSGAHESADGLVGAMRDEGLDVALVCAGRKAEPSELTAAVDALRGAGATWVGLAQASDARAEEVGADAGVKDGMDMIALLSALLDRVTVERAG